MSNLEQSTCLRMNTSFLGQYTCSPGEAIIFNPVDTTSNSVSYYTGTPTVCVNGSSLPVCNGTSLDKNAVSRFCLRSAKLISKLRAVISVIIE